MTEDIFLRAIRQAPDDPAPRLIYADWLEEQGDARSALLRLHEQYRQDRRPETWQQAKPLFKAANASWRKLCAPGFFRRYQMDLLNDAFSRFGLSLREARGAYMATSAAFAALSHLPAVQMAAAEAARHERTQRRASLRDTGALRDSIDRD